MKQRRVFAVFILLLISLTPFFSACASSDGGKDTRAFLEILQSGNYTLEGDGIYEGIHCIIAEYVAGDNVNVIYRNANDSSFRYLYDDGEIYRYLDTLCLYSKAPEGEPFPNVAANAIDYDYSSAVYTGSDKQTIHDVTYPYDIYSIKKHNGDDAVMHLYLSPDNGVLYAIGFPDDDIAITVSSFMAGIPDYIFTEFSEDFEEVDYSQIETQTEI